jgi:RND family efflux transporter MFP subunit
MLLVCATLAAGCSGPDTGRQDTQAEPVAIVAHQVRHRPEETRVEVVGTARARAAATIYPESSGEVIDVMFRAGQFVREGAPLVRLESREEALAVKLAEVAVAEAEQLLARYRRIEGTGAISASQIDEGRTALDAARIQLEQAKVALSKRTVHAPFSGHTGLTDVDAGARITSTTPITQLDDRSSLYVDFSPPEQVFGRISAGDSVSVRPFADRALATEATILSVDSRIEPSRRTFVVRAEIDNDDDLLRPGMSFSVDFSIQGESFPAVPEAAILWGSDGAYVWGIEESGPKRIPINIVSREQGYVLVQGDIPDGSFIVAEGVQKVRADTPLVGVERQSVPAGGPRNEARDEGHSQGSGQGGAP